MKLMGKIGLQIASPIGVLPCKVLPLIWLLPFGITLLSYYDAWMHLYFFVLLLDNSTCSGESVIWV